MIDRNTFVITTYAEQNEWDVTNPAVDTAFAAQGVQGRVGGGIRRLYLTNPNRVRTDVVYLVRTISEGTFIIQGDRIEWTYSDGTVRASHFAHTPNTVDFGWYGQFARQN